ncbi:MULTISPECIES: SIS domain-containing protein [unclassified Roseitalea]|uniref:SIS domain-containing protein n=1 Tax=unclassified Roseitalea TaxID=2639107 RepID=UPI00273D1D9E|nr:MULTISPECIES: SIS domain-containing protein [unclassified Roseitalea]
MCGIAGLVTRPFDDTAAELGWVPELLRTVEALDEGEDAAETLRGALAVLADRFGLLMSIAAVRQVALDGALEADIRALAEALTRHEKALTALSEAGRTDLDPLIEGLRDYAWQLRAELADHAANARALMADADPRAGHALHVAVAAEYVLRAIDRLEVRGRDSAGLALQIDLPPSAVDSLAPDHATALAQRCADMHAGHGAVYLTPNGDGTTATFLYKTANLVGRLGDNGAALRAAIGEDALLRALSVAARRASILSHTRWASHGVISVANCHPHNGSLCNDGAPEAATLGAMFALNGDVDNHHELLTEMVTNRQMAVDAAITTDAKIIPIADRLSGEADAERLERFRSAIRRLDGSVAIGCIDPARPGEAFLAQKGSGQGLHAARLVDGWVFASEVYGLCNLARASADLARSVAGGSVIHLDARSDTAVMRTVNDGAVATVNPSPIQIFARDIYRGAFSTFLEKEIHDGPASVAKTLRGRYRRKGGLVAFDDLANDIWAPLRDALKGGLARVYVIGQGTAGVAAVGIGHLIEKALSRDARRAIPVEAVRSSELSADIEAYDLADALVIAVSQSGTTTDTNRAVDLARERGAFVHAIVNRRNSDLVRKAGSTLFTSDGRDVEMSVASTKAFYAQIAAGKLTALFLAERLGTMTEVELAYEMGELERLPGHIAAVLADEAHIAACARDLAPRSRYWAVTGSGVNHIAALEIRIKLSELCYKSIPVDYTEDKKHIDLSTEPLTLVVANDLPGDLVGDVVKEAAIFKAHNGKPVVFATRGADAQAFADNAERVIALPDIGADLAFVLATVAGHLFGFHAAQAIDDGARKLKPILSGLSLIAMDDDQADAGAVMAALDAFVDEAAAGAFDSGLGAGNLARLAQLSRTLRAAGEPSERRAIAQAAIADVRAAFEETSRPVDTIRHQAKTVTVGTSRPEDALSSTIRHALAALGIADSRMSFDNRKILAAVSRMVDAVRWSALLDVETDQGVPRVALAAGGGAPDTLAAYGARRAPMGVIGSALDTNRLVCGFIDTEAVIAVPVTGTSFDRTEHVLCLSVGMLAHASREQKTAVMNALGAYQTTLRQWEQTLGSDAEAALQREIARHDPLTVTFRPSAIDALNRDDRASA